MCFSGWEVVGIGERGLGVYHFFFFFFRVLWIGSKMEFFIHNLFF